MYTLQNLIVITGNRHEAAVVQHLPPTADQWPILEVSVSPLSQMSSPTRGWTLSERSLVKKMTVETQIIDGKEVTVDVEEELPREILLEGLACGSYKWCVQVLARKKQRLIDTIRATFEVDTRDRERPTVSLELWVGGKERYTYV
jgi:alkaline phosphatase D